MILDVVTNIALLLILSVVYATYPFKDYKTLSSHSILVGCVVGVFGILIMLKPFVLATGVVFDSRSILICVTGMFFGFVPAALASFIMALYRIFTGGSGLPTGLLVILFSLLVGTLWHKYRLRSFVEKQKLLNLEFLLVGFINHIGMFFIMFTMPSSLRPLVLSTMAFPILVYYPIGSYLLCLLLYSQMQRFTTIKELKKSEQQFKTMFEQAPIGMSLTNLITGEITSVNQSYLDILAMKREDLLCRRWEEITYPEDKKISAEITEKMRLGDEGPFNFDKRFIRSDGSVVWTNLSLSVFDPGEEGVMESLCMTIDISQRKSEEERVLYASTHDSLTDLYDRSHFETYVRDLKVEGKLPLSVVFGDVNALRIINEAFGREEGNLLLQRIASIIKKSIKPEDYASRVGGDEIALILFNTPVSDAELLIKEIREKVSELKVQNSVRTSISLGVCGMNTIEEDLNEIIKKAEKDVGNRKLMESPHMRGRAVYAIINTLHEKNKREELHSRRVSDLCEKMAQVLEMSEWQVSELKLLGLLHDIGKIAISETILNKQGKLSGEEWIEMKRHAEIGYRILIAVDDMNYLAGYVLAHHERFDGTGYPKGLKGLEIPLQSRIISIADAYDAMTAERTYRKAISVEDAAKELLKHAGSQFDPDLVVVFAEKVLGFRKSD
ncbi:MAG: diguanylate cyclase [Sphaerochaeta sp.]|nr:diguanylate cyclase [Sphaerochaeta sp.]